MIEKLDAVPRQVVIQALIVEVQLNNTDEFRIELGLQSPGVVQPQLDSNSDHVSDNEYHRRW